MPQNGDIFWDGFDAYKKGRLRSANPYPQDSEAYVLWDEGWIAGDTDNQLNDPDDLRPW